MALGLAPAALALHRPWLLPYLLIGSIAIVITAVRGLRVPSPTRATVPEFLLAGVNAAVLPALLGVIWLVLYLVASWTVRLVNQATGLHGNDQFIALGLSLTFVAAVGVGVAWYITRDLGTALYPRWGGSRTRYFYKTLPPWATVSVGIGTLLLVSAVVGAALVTSSWTSTAVWVVILLFVIAAGAASQPAPSPSSPEDPRMEDVQAIGEVLSKRGYRVVAYPRTGNPGVDPLVRDLELFSYSKKRAYAVEIKRGLPGAEPLDWTAGTSVFDAARALERANLTETNADVWPILVVLDAKADDSLRAFCRDEHVSLVRVERAIGTSEVVGHDDSDMQAIVRRCLALARPQHKSDGLGARKWRRPRGESADAHLG